jgi:hypothetical protein
MAAFSFSGLRKYHFHVFRSNILGIILGVFFFRAYQAKAIELTPIISVILAASAFLVCIVVILKPLLKLRGILPDTWLLIFNLVVAFAISLLFYSQIGLIGIAFCMVLSFFLSEVGHLIHGRIR